MALGEIEIHYFKPHIIYHIHKRPVRCFGRDHRTDERESVIRIHIL